MNRNATKSSSQDFSKSVSVNIPRSKFYRPSTQKTTFNAGKLVPIFIDEILPGDTYNMKIQHVCKLITPLTPTMDNLELEFFAFFVPNRIVWDGWAELMGENKTDYWTPPTTPTGVPTYKAGSSTTQEENKLGDYYGIPVGMDFYYHGINLLPFRGYYQIWNEWFRNQNLQSPYAPCTSDSAFVYGTSGSPAINGDLLNVNKPFDYFTACLPDPQKGDSQLIPIELNELIPVITSTEHWTSGVNSGGGIRFRKDTDGNIIDGNVSLNGSGTMQADDAAPGAQSTIAPSNLWADPTGLGNITSTTISDLRTAFQVQKLYERDARGGTRYVEILKSHFGVDARDYRLQRPEYLGHAKSLINITQVAQTSETNTTPQATLTAYGQSQGNDFLFNKSFVEHGFLHIFAVARHKKTYQQGLEKFWSRQDRLDYYMPVLAHISEQPVYTKELYCLANNPDTVFGYQEAWSDYRYKPSKTSAQMRSDNSDTFEIWHYADDYSVAPTLNDTWMQDNSSENLARTIAISGTIHDLKLDVRFDLTCIRPIPVNSIPGYIDHF